MNKQSIQFVLLVLFSALIVSAQPAGADAGGQQRGNGQGRLMGMGRANALQQAPAPDSLSSLSRFVNLSDKQLIAIKGVIDQILEMSPEERAALKSQIAEYEKLDPQKQQMIRQGWGSVSEGYRNDWREMMLSLDTNERQIIQEKMQTLDFEKRNEFRVQKIDEWRKNRADQ